MAKLLLIDAGNTRTKWAIAEPHEKIRVGGELPTKNVTPARLEKLAARFPAHRVMLACVVPAALREFQRAFGPRLHVLTGTTHGVPLSPAYPNPKELGADRVAAALAANADRAWPAIIVSCGTAMAVTVLDARGRLCGGVIAPGLQSQLDALLGATALLPATSLRPPRRLPATSTKDAIRAGVLLSYQGAAREIVGRLQGSPPAKSGPRILLTGGDAGHLVAVFGRSAQVRPLLVFEGLRIMGERLFFASAS